MKFLGLIPSRLKSKRLKEKALLKISGIPIVVHTYKRAKMSKFLDDLIVCTDSKKISRQLTKFKAKFQITSVSHRNGTERIAEVSKKIKSDFIVDIQGDEPFINPAHIDNLINFHKKNTQFDIVVPHLKISSGQNENLVKIVSDLNKRVLYFSRHQIPYEFKKSTKYFKKHLSIISFKRKALLEFSKLKESPLEKIEGIELMRAIENGMCVGTFLLTGDSFAIDKLEDYQKALIQIQNDKISKKYIK
tara:strand:- start:215 stop:955 length:741 start_codon:yes stop_codon:yes gene_type:complete